MIKFLQLLACMAAYLNQMGLSQTAITQKQVGL